MANYRKLWFDNNKSLTGWYTCSWCKKKIRKQDVDIDHIIPQSLGGKDVLSNLQCMCKSCNRSKKNDVGFHTVKDLGKNFAKKTTKDLASSLFKKKK